MQTVLGTDDLASWPLRERERYLQGVRDARADAAAEFAHAIRLLDAERDSITDPILAAGPPAREWIDDWANIDLDTIIETIPNLLAMLWTRATEAKAKYRAHGRERDQGMAIAFFSAYVHLWEIGSRRR